MTLKISFKSLHINMSRLPFPLLCAEMVWKLGLEIRPKDGLVRFPNLGRMAGCVYTGEGLNWRQRGERPGLLGSRCAAEAGSGEGRAGGRRIHRESEAPIAARPGAI